MESSSISTTKTESPETMTNKTTGNKPSSFFSIVRFVFILIVLAAVVFLWYQQMCLRKELSGSDHQMKQMMTNQSKGMNDQISQFSTQLSTQQEEINKLNSQLSQLIQTEPTNDKAWKQSEIIYLVKLANLQLTVAHSSSEALQLLKQAQVLLNSIQSPELENFGNSLSKAVDTLENIPEIDTVALSGQLTSLGDQVSNLSILVAPKPNTEVLKQTEHQVHKKWWQRAWDNIKASMQQLVVVRHQQELPALMSPDQQMYLQENLQLLLMQAQWALMNHNATLYQDSLKKAKSWVEKYYVQNSATTQDFLKQLQSLISTNIAPEYPDLSQTLALVSQE